MSDWADEACAMEGLYLAAALTQRIPLKISLNGTCHNCAEPSDELFCDADCRDDYEQREKFNGKAPT